MDSKRPRLLGQKVLALAVGAAIAATTLLGSAATPPAHAQAAYVQRVRVGSGTPFTDSLGSVWAADRAYSPGGFGYTQGAYVWSSSAVIANTPDSPLFQNNRHDANLAYRFDVPNGT